MSLNNNLSNNDKNLNELSWADTLADFLKHVQISEKPLNHAKSTPAKMKRLRLDLPIEKTTTDARKLIRLENFEKLNSRKQDKIIGMKIQEFKETLEKERRFYKLDLDYHAELNRRPRQSKPLCLNLPKSVLKTTPSRSIAIPAKTKVLHQIINDETNVQPLKVHEVSGKNLSKDIIKKAGSINFKSTRESKEIIGELSTSKKKELFNESHQKNKEKAIKNNMKLKITNTIKSKNILILSNYLAQKNKQYYFSKWKLFVRSQKNKRDEEKKWMEKINCFMQRLHDRSDVKRSILKEENILQKPELLKNKRKETGRQLLPHPHKTLPDEIKRNSDLDEIARLTNQSRADAKHQLRPASVKSLHPDLKGKAKLIRLVAGKEKIESFDAKTEHPNPAILLTMDQKHEERKKRLAEIQEKKRRIEEEKDRLAKEKYVQQLLEAELEKKRKLREFREKQRQEQLEQEKRKAEWKRMKELQEKAVHHFNNRLKKQTMNVWCRLLQRRQSLKRQADLQNNRRLVRLTVEAWKQAIKVIEDEKSTKALALRTRHLKMMCFVHWQELMMRRSFQRQAAEDWYDYFLSRSYLKAWMNFVLMEQKSKGEKWNIAVVHYKRKLLMKTLQHWMLLPQIIVLEREKEYRKQEWREKVQQVLPDFRPIIAAHF